MPPLRRSPASQADPDTPATPPHVLLLAPATARPETARCLDAVAASLRSGGARVTRTELDDKAGRVRPTRWIGATGTAGATGATGAAASARTAGSDLVDRCRSLWATAATARTLGPLDSVVVGQIDLTLAGLITARLTGAPRVPVLFHGVDMWTMPRHLRLLLRHDPLLHPVTSSSFGAGALSPIRVGAILPPGLDGHWRQTLLAEAARRRPLPPVPTVLSVFPLADWEDKGLPTLLEALRTTADRLGPVRLVVAGPGPAPDALHAHLAGREHTEFHEDPTDEKLAKLHATADLFALCTRTRSRPPVSGEAHPTTLLEAQLAGCAVIGPARGGSRDAYQRGVTGWAPADESAPALAQVLTELLADRARLARAGRQASDWARNATDPDDHARAVFAALLGRPADPSTPPAGERVDGRAEGKGEKQSGAAGTAAVPNPAPRPAEARVGRD